MNLKKIFLLSSILFYSGLFLAQNTFPSFESIHNHRINEGAVISYGVVNLSNKQTIGSFNSNALISPASTLKLFLGMKIFDKYSMQDQFKTSINIEGFVEEGVLHGNIIVIGGGDPSLNGKLSNAITMEQMTIDIINQLKKNRIDCIDGRLIIDASFLELPGIPTGYTEEDIANYYGAGCYGLNYNENSFEVLFQQNRRERIAKVISFDKKEAKTIVNKVISKGNSDQAYIHYGPENDMLVLTGSIPKGKGQFKIKGAMKNPPMSFGRTLNDKLYEAGYEINKGTKVYWTKYQGLNQLIWTKSYLSPNFEALIKETLFNSNNLYAEAFNRLLKRDDYQWPSTVMIRDGAGLSPQNSLNVDWMLNEMQLLYDKRGLEELSELLPKNAQSGNVKSVLKSMPGALYLKSGTIGNVRAYAGFRKTKTDEWLGFSIVLNNHKGSSSEAKRTLEPFLAWIAKQ